MKILHIATDDKFLDQAFPVFEKVFPGANQVFVFSAKTPLEYVKLNPDHIETGRSGFFKNKPKIGKEVYSKYNLVIFHSLESSTYRELENIPDGVATIWLGWGFDYYLDLLNGFPLYLERTRQIQGRLVSANPKRRAAALFKALMGLFGPRNRKIQAVERISVFSPVLPKEYDMVKNSRSWRRFPKFAPWNYGTMEDDLIKGFEGESVADNAILVGNSATYTGNHVEAFDLLRKLQVDDRQVVVPLSYGDPQLATKLISMGQEYFADNFEPLMNFMPVENYVEIIKKCGYVIMNHVRQQAVGNIVIMLYLGARVFVRKENPVYDFFKKSGVTISTVQELATNAELLNEPLTKEQRASNRKIVSDYWSHEKACERTRKLVQTALEGKGVEYSAALAETRW